MHDLVTLNGSPRAIKGSESLARIDSPFDRSMVLLQVVVQVGTGSTAAAPSQFPLPLQFRHDLRIARVAVHINHARAGMTRSLQSSLEKTPGGCRIPLRRKPKINRGARGIDRAIEIV